jgi:phage shock protein A
MTRWKRWTSGFVASIDSVIAQVENHEAQVASALRELEQGILRSKVQLGRVERDGVALRRTLGEERESTVRWRERAQREADEKRALECLRRAKRAEARSIELEKQRGDHERVQTQLTADIRTLEERLVELRQQRNTMRTRQSRAEALSVAQGMGDLREGEIGQIFERWESRVAESEISSGCDRSSVDTFDAEFTDAEEEAALKAELRALKSLGEHASGEQAPDEPSLAEQSPGLNVATEERV